MALDEGDRVRAIADQQVLRGVAATLSYQFVDSDGTAAAPAGDVTVTVTRADGTVIDTDAATGGTTTAPRTYSLASADNQTLDLLTAVWTDDGDGSTHTTYVEVVGGYYFSVAEARASDATLTDTTKYPNAAVVAARREVEEEFERICGVAFVPRFAVETMDGPGCARIELTHHPVREVRFVRAYSDATTYLAWTVDELASLVHDDEAGWGVVTSRTGVGFARGSANLMVGWEHGMDRPPAEVKRAALQRLRYRLNMSLAAIPDRATSFSVTEGGTYSLSTAGAAKTGMPDVDAVLDRWSRDAAGVG